MFPRSSMFGKHVLDNGTNSHLRFKAESIEATDLSRMALPPGTTTCTQFELSSGQQQATANAIRNGHQAFSRNSSSTSSSEICETLTSSLDFPGTQASNFLGPFSDMTQFRLQQEQQPSDNSISLLTAESLRQISRHRPYDVTIERIMGTPSHIHTPPPFQTNLIPHISVSNARPLLEPAASAIIPTTEEAEDVLPDWWPFAPLDLQEQVQNSSALFPQPSKSHGKIASNSQNLEIQSEIESRRNSSSSTTSGAKHHDCPYSECSKSFGKLANLKAHILTHTGERPFACECGASFTTRNRLKVHMRTHNGQRPYKCDYPGCNYASKQKCGLTSHAFKHLSKEEKVVLQQQNEKTIVCAQCHRKYKTLESLHQHSRREHGKTGEMASAAII